MQTESKSYLGGALYRILQQNSTKKEIEILEYNFN